MERSIDIKDTNISVLGKECNQCEQTFTQEDEDEKNFELHYDTTGDVDLKEDASRFRFKLTLYVREITHQLGTYKIAISEKPLIEKTKEYYNCPSVRKCERCGKKDLEEKMIEDDFRYYHQKCIRMVNFI